MSGDIDVNTTSVTGSISISGSNTTDPISSMTCTYNIYIHIYIQQLPSVVTTSVPLILLSGTTSVPLIIPQSQPYHSSSPSLIWFGPS